MARQNRVTPAGEIIATPARGALMGNRGILHTPEQQLIRRWAHPHWVICLTCYRGRRHAIMQPGCYTELFFLDEATALAAGHRPCATCQRERFNLYRSAFLVGNADRLPAAPLHAGDIDRLLHHDRLVWQGKQKEKRLFSARLSDLPTGVFVLWEEVPHLWYIGRLWPWTPAGYALGQAVTATDLSQIVDVLTPRATVAALWHGFHPIIHASIAG